MKYCNNKNHNKFSLNNVKTFNKHPYKEIEKQKLIKYKTNNLPSLPMELNIKILNFSGGFCRLRGSVFKELLNIFDRASSNLPSIIINSIKDWSNNPINTHNIGYFKIVQDNHQLISSFKSTSKNAKLELNELYLIDSSLKPYCMAIRSLLSQISNKDIQTCTYSNSQLYPGGNFSYITFLMSI